jgi:peroxiredoxin
VTTEFADAPEWDVSGWLNSDKSRSLAEFKGKVVVAGAFQMLCPGCVSELIPQLRSVHALFGSLGVVTLGLHTVFEHHDAMRPVSLKAFLHENRILFPVAVDREQMPQTPIPVTMQRYSMRGTPTVLLIDKSGRLRRQIFGHVADLQLGAEIMALVGE